MKNNYVQDKLMQTFTTEMTHCGKRGREDIDVIPRYLKHQLRLMS